MPTVENQTNFQITSRGAYTHGLEEIYKVETIDLKSVRRMEIREEVSQKANLVETHTSFPQLALDLGPGFREWMTPFLDKEPIQVLDFNKQLEKWLLENSYDTIGALRHADLSSEPFVRKMGQGHRDELANKLNGYIKGKPIKETTSIDFLSFLKCAAGRVEKKKLFVALKPFGLETWLTLSPMEQVDIKRLGKNEQELWTKEVMHNVNHEFLKEAYGKIAETWLIPWIEKRSGVATGEELYEYLLLRSSDSEISTKVLNFLRFPFEKVLVHSRDFLFFSTSHDRKRFEDVEALLLTYFPTSYCRYHIQDLYRFVVAEAGEMITFPFFKKVLSYSGLFQILQDFVDISCPRQ